MFIEKKNSKSLLLAQKRFRKRWNILFCIICSQRRNLLSAIWKYWLPLENHFILPGCRSMLITVTSTALHYLVLSHTNHHCLDITVSLLRYFSKPNIPWDKWCTPPTISHSTLCIFALLCDMDEDGQRKFPKQDYGRSRRVAR